MIQPGKKVAKATAIRFVKPGQTLGFQVAMEFEEAGHKERLFWNGWCSPAAQKQTIKTLDEVFEWNGDDTVVQVSDEDPKKGWLANQDCINMKKEYEIVVEFELNPKDGKNYPRIKWVNNLGGGQFAGASVETVRNELGATGFMEAYRAKKAGKLLEAAPQSLATSSLEDAAADGLPF